MLTFALFLQLANVQPCELIAFCQIALNSLYNRCPALSRAVVCMCCVCCRIGAVAVEHEDAVPEGHRGHAGDAGAGGVQAVPGHVQRPVHGEDTRVEADMRGADGEGVPDRGLGERGRHQVPPEVAEPGEVVPELPDQLDGPEQPGAQEAAAVLRGAARHTQDEEEVRERGRVHADGGGGRRHDRPGHVGKRWRRRRRRPAERLGRGGGAGRRGRAERRPLLRGGRRESGPDVQADEGRTAVRVLAHERRR